MLLMARRRVMRTQAEVAKEAGISEAMYQRYEYGQNEPSVRVAIRIADVLGVDVREIFGDLARKGGDQTLADSE